MKKLTLSVLALATAAISITSCKKGDEDGALSLSSRKARFAGEWTVGTMDWSNTMTDKNNGSSSYTETTNSSMSIDGGSYSSKWDFSTNENNAFYTKGNGTTTGSVVSYTYTIEKDGTWKSHMEYKETSATTSQTYSSGGASTTTTDTDNLDRTITEDAEGTWQFLGKNKSLEEKNKESVSLATTKMTRKVVDVCVGCSTSQSSTDVTNTTYGTNEKVEVWHLTMLKKKEMTADAVMESTDGGTNTSVYGGTTTTTTDNDVTNKGTAVMTFTQE